MLSNYLDIILIIIGIIFSSTYLVIVKSLKHEQIATVYWSLLLTHAGYLLLYNLKRFYFQLEENSIEKIIYHLNYDKIFLLITASLLTTAAIIMFHYLLSSYEISILRPLSKLSILFAFTLLIFLEKTFNASFLIGAVIMSIGALLPIANQIIFKFKKISALLIFFF